MSSYSDGELVPFSGSNEVCSPEPPESQSAEKRITRSQHRTEAAKSLNETERTTHPVTSAQNICENHDRAINIVEDIEMNPMTDMFAQDESTNHDDFSSTNETLDQNGKLNTT